MNEHSVIAGVFDNDSDAQGVINAIAQAGISRADIGLHPSATIPLDSDITTAGATEHSTAPFVQLFRAVLGMDDDEEQYMSLFSRFIDGGCSVVTIEVADKSQLDAVAEIMDRFKPIDIGVVEDTVSGPQSVRWTRRGTVHVFSHRPDNGGAS